MRAKLLIIGHKRSGKDTLAEILSKHFDFTFMSSSLAAAEEFIYDALRDKYGYRTFKECYEDRVNRRAEWFDLICEYNQYDKTRLAKKILSKNDCYVGMRSSEEIEQCKREGLIDLVIWVDASGRVEDEGSDSFNIKKEDADIVIENNTTLKDFEAKVKRFGALLY